MTRDDLLKLLGGYATGTLTAEEKNLLFTAALDDQELFDALADEQALKEMLEDPECRARLLAATSAESGRLRVVPMPVPAPKKARPRWLVPLGIAASVIVIAVCGGDLFTPAVDDANGCGSDAGAAGGTRACAGDCACTGSCPATRQGVAAACDRRQGGRAPFAARRCSAADGKERGDGEKGSAGSCR